MYNNIFKGILVSSQITPIFTCKYIQDHLRYRPRRPPYDIRDRLRYRLRECHVSKLVGQLLVRQIE